MSNLALVVALSAPHHYSRPHEVPVDYVTVQINIYRTSLLFTLVTDNIHLECFIDKCVFTRNKTYQTRIAILYE